jgi:hypothetical protein
MSPRKPSHRVVREPVQVYLDPDDRKLLDSLARTTGLSRAEILRRGIRSFAASARGGAGGPASPMLAYLDEVNAEHWPDDLAQRHDEFLARAHRPT